MSQLSKKLINRPLNTIFLIWAVFYSKSYRCYSFSRNLLRILKLLIKQRLNLSENNNVLAQIDINEYSPIILRDLLMALNYLGNQILSSENRSVNLSLNIYGDAKIIERGDIFTCCQMNPFVGNLYFGQADRAQAENNTIIHMPADDRKTANLNVQVSFDGGDRQLQSINYINSIHRNCLRVPQLSTRVWALNILKTFKPASFIVCFHIPEDDRGSELSNFKEWRHFFMRVWDDLSCVHFLLLNYSLDLGKEFAIDLPNVTPIKMLGYSLLEEFALVQSAEMYIGSFDKYAALVIGTEKPYLLFKLNEFDRNTLTEFIDPASQLLSTRQKQILMAENISPDYLFNYFRQFYPELFTNHNFG